MTHKGKKVTTRLRNTSHSHDVFRDTDLSMTTLELSGGVCRTADLQMAIVKAGVPN